MTVVMIRWLCIYIAIVVLLIDRKMRRKEREFVDSCIYAFNVLCDIRVIYTSIYSQTSVASYWWFEIFSRIHQKNLWKCYTYIWSNITNNLWFGFESKTYIFFFAQRNFVLDALKNFKCKCVCLTSCVY